MCRLRAKDAEIRLLFGSSEITFPVFVGEALDFCIKGPAFFVREVPDSLDEAGKVVLVRRLVKEGVLVRVDEDVPARQKPELTMA
jgi:hypothetical protein